jgi:hypothetical protein
VQDGEDVREDKVDAMVYAAVVPVEEYAGDLGKEPA